MSTQAKEKCPLCLETMDLTDKQLKPCKCGYEICLWCWHHIMEMDQKDECGGRCPGCRSIYNKNRILGTGINNQILKGICADRSNLQKEQTKSQKQKSVKNQVRVEEEPVDLNNVRVIQRNLVYIVGMPSEFAKEKVLRQKNFLGQYGKIGNIIIDNVGANQQIPDSGRVYVTFSREEEAIRCIEAVNGYILDGRLLRATFGVTRYCHVWLNNKVCRKSICSYVHKKAPPEDICTKDDVALVCARLHQMLGMDLKGPQQRSGSTLPSPGDCNSRTTNRSEILKDKPCINYAKVLSNVGYKNPGALSVATPRDSSVSSANSSSVVNATLYQQNNHERILNDQESSSVSKFQELPPLVLKDRLNEQLASSDDKSQESTQLGNDIANSKQMTLAGNGTVHTALSKPHYVNIVSQGSSGSGRRFTVLTRQGTSTDARSKTTGQVGNLILNSEKVTSAKDEHSDGNAIPICQNALEYLILEQRKRMPAQISVISQSRKNICLLRYQRLLSEKNSDKKGFMPYPLMSSQSYMCQKPESGNCPQPSPEQPHNPRWNWKQLATRWCLLKAGDLLRSHSVRSRPQLEEPNWKSLGGGGEVVGGGGGDRASGEMPYTGGGEVVGY